MIQVCFKYQIDFKTNKINLIKRGTVQYKCDFDDLSYDSEVTFYDIFFFFFLLLTSICGEVLVVDCKHQWRS